MKRGWQVYRALSADAPYDMVVDTGERLLRVEVKLLRANVSTLRHPKVTPVFGSHRHVNWDLMCLVDRVSDKVWAFVAPASYEAMIDRIRADLGLDPAWRSPAVQLAVCLDD